MDKEQIEVMFELLEEIRDLLKGKQFPNDISFTEEVAPKKDFMDFSNQCDKCGSTDGYWVNESKSEKNPGRHFKKCKKCGNFLGWTSEELSVVKK